MKVSVVTISFNQARYVARAMTSVLSQDFPDIEYIVVDPGSTDGSREIIAAFAGRLTRVVTEPDGGPAAGLNNGFGFATGDVVAYLNADDALLPGAAREAVDYLVSHPDVDVVYGDGYLIDADGRVIRPIESSPFDLRRYVYGGVMVLQQATFIRKQVFDRVGGFNPANRTCWDAELIVDMAMQGAKFGRARRSWGAFAIYPETITGSRRLWDQYVLDQRRLFSRVYGREWNTVDSVVSRLVRVEKWLVSPGTTLRRFRASASGPPGLRVIDLDGAQVVVVADP